MAKVKIDMEVEGVGTARREWKTRLDGDTAAYVYATYLDLLIAAGNAKLSGALAELGPNPTDGEVLQAAIKAIDA